MMRATAMGLLLSSCFLLASGELVFLRLSGAWCMSSNTYYVSLDIFFSGSNLKHHICVLHCFKVLEGVHIDVAGVVPMAGCLQNS